MIFAPGSFAITAAPVAGESGVGVPAFGAITLPSLVFAGIASPLWLDATPDDSTWADIAAGADAWIDITPDDSAWGNA